MAISGRNADEVEDKIPDTKNETSEKDNTTEPSKEKKPEPPFQRLDFLVRDWEHFEDDAVGYVMHC